MDRGLDANSVMPSEEVLNTTVSASFLLIITSKNNVVRGYFMIFVGKWARTGRHFCVHTGEGISTNYSMNAKNDHAECHECPHFQKSGAPVIHSLHQRGPLAGRQELDSDNGARPDSKIYCSMTKCTRRISRADRTFRSNDIQGQNQEKLSRGNYFARDT